MILGMSLATFVQVHVVISLIGIVAGIIVMFGMLGSKRMPGLTALFLSTTILTSATGFLIPPLVTEKFLPSHLFGFLSLGLLAVACFALYGKKLLGAWRWIYVLTALISLYLNVFVLVIQSFLKVPRCTHWRRAYRRPSRPSPSRKASCWCSSSSSSSVRSGGTGPCTRDPTPSLRAQRSNPSFLIRRHGLLRRIRLRPKAGFGGQGAPRNDVERAEFYN